MLLEDVASSPECPPFPETDEKDCQRSGAGKEKARAEKKQTSVSAVWAKGASRQFRPNDVSASHAHCASIQSSVCQASRVSSTNAKTTK